MWQEQLIRDLIHATLQERGEIVRKYSEQYGVTREHVYRVARTKGWSSGRKTRDCKGSSRLTFEQLEMIAAVLFKTGRENKGPIMPIENAMEWAIDNGFIRRGEISLRRMQSLLQEHQLNKERLKDPTPHTEMRSLHPNHVHEADVSTCIQYYLADNGGLEIMPEDEFYKNKIENFKKVKQELKRYVLVDHFSAFIFVKYYIAQGESAANLFDFLCSAWEAKADRKLPFRGVPLVMLMDAGSAAKAKEMRGFFQGLDINIIPGKPGNSRRQGSVEGHHNIWEEWFETRLRINPARDLADLNRKAFEYCIWFNATRKLGRMKMTRLSAWQMIKAEQIRELPERESLKELLNRPEEKRTARNYRISYQNREFNLKFIPGLPYVAEVQIIKNVWKWQEGIVIVAFEGQHYEARAIDKLSAEQGGFSANSAIIGQEFKAQPETVTQAAKKRLNELATGEKFPNKRAAVFPDTNAFEGFADKVANLVPLPKVGTPLSISRSIIPKQQSMTDFIKDLRNEIGRVTPELNKQLKAEFGETIDRETAEDIKMQILSGTYGTASTTRHLKAV